MDDEIELLAMYRQLEAGDSSPHTPPAHAASALPTFVRSERKSAITPSSPADTDCTITSAGTDEEIELLAEYRQLEAGDASPQVPPGAAATSSIRLRQSGKRLRCSADKELAAAKCTYDELDEGFFRLVRIIQAPSTGRIECWTEQFLLQDPPPYTAVSYACGSRPAKFNLRLNGRDWYVRKNLFRFLRQRLQMDRDSHEWLWIDAICINQANPSERTHQVRLMADIYGKASRVLAWLGPAYEDSDAAMRGLIGSQGHGRSLETVTWMLAFVGLCSRRYWHRLWVLQELKLAKQKYLMCGSKVVSWQHFETIMLLINRSFTESAPLALSERTGYIQNGAAMRMIRLMSMPTGTSLWDLLNMSVHLQCEEKRDRVFALCGLATTEAASIDPDYDIDMSVLLNNIFRYHTEQTPDISIRTVVSACKKLESMFETPPGTIFELHDPRNHIPGQPGLIYRRLCPSSIDMPGLTLLWAIHYNHLRVQKLIKMVHRLRSPAHYIFCGSEFIGFVAALPFAYRWKGVTGYDGPFLLLAVHVFLLVFYYLYIYRWLLMLSFIDLSQDRVPIAPWNSRAVLEHPTNLASLCWVSFLMTEGLIHIAALASRSLERWFPKFNFCWLGK